MIKLIVVISYFNQIRIFGKPVLFQFKRPMETCASHGDMCVPSETCASHQRFVRPIEVYASHCNFFIIQILLPYCHIDRIIRYRYLLIIQKL
jgi:hypothetical protein